nr:hypothetical protein Iba_chr07bCG0580 [Ipomoea batatas]GMD15621.1 hypothetical protein Iba_chr07cCG1510 [Ipomoea batatas]GMD18540.1 hypothetical protein Iba_chr07eCG0140 [Ipomoea batatas]GMD19988.1 hypothetical protein Iba_chr07fCG0530 [Ipomoea batatas]
MLGNQNAPFQAIDWCILQATHFALSPKALFHYWNADNEQPYLSLSSSTLQPAACNLDKNLQLSSLMPSENNKQQYP